MTLEAYAFPASVEAGEPIRLHVSTDRTRVDVEIAREGAGREVRWRGTIDTEHNDTPLEASSNGCGWPIAAEIPTDAGWRSGYHSISVTAGFLR